MLETEKEQPEVIEEELDLGEEEAQEQQEEVKEEADGDVVITFGDEPSDDAEQEKEQAPDWVKKLRQEHKELRRENKELKAKTQSAAVQPELPKLEAKPKLEDHDYDAEAYEAAVDKWYEQKRAYDDAVAKANADKAAAESEWNQCLENYAKGKSALKVADFDDAEFAVVEKLSQDQQAIIVRIAESPAKMVFALGKNAAKLDDVAKIKDPLKFTAAIVKLETVMKESTRKAPAPERKIVGDSGTSGTVDSQLERLRDEAAKTGDMTKVMQYKAQQRAKQK